MTLRKLLTVSQVCRTLPGARENSRITPSTITRWILLGCRARNGQRVRLRATRCGARWLIAPEELAAFFDALAADGPPPPAPTSTSNPARDHRGRAAQAAAELSRRGA